MANTPSMASHKKYNLNANEDFVMSFKLITCFNDDFTSDTKFHSIAYLLSGNAHVYWILDLKVKCTL